MPEATESNSQPLESNNQVGAKLARLLPILVLGAAIAAGYWWFFMRHRISTDNAYVAAESAVVSSRIPGTIVQVLVDNDAPVAVGQTLLQLDPRDNRVELDRRRAALQQIEAEIQVAEVTIRLVQAQTSAKIAMAEAGVAGAEDHRREAQHGLEQLQQQRLAALADLAHAKKDAVRYSNLFKDGAGSEQQRDRARTSRKKTEANVEALDAGIEAARATLSAVLQEGQRAKAQLELAKAERLHVDVENKRLQSLQAKAAEVQAQVRAAKLKISYCTIAAPISGYVTQKRIQMGERILPGQALLAVVPLENVFVEANFKETQLEGVRIGQPAEITADIYPGHRFHGQVVGIRAGTGAAFSLLPPENATGNWIKVVQRVPVKIHLDEPPDPDYPLRVGLSLEVTVHTADQSGPRLVGDSKTARAGGADPS